MHRFRCLAVSLTILAVAACSTPGRPMADPRVALFYAKAGSIYVSDPGGTPARKLTDGPNDTQPAPSPDGRRVAFVRKANADEPGGELWLLDVTSGEKHRLVNPADLTPKFAGDDRPAIGSPRWSPAGDRIAFLKSTYGGGGFLLTAAADTGAVMAPPKPLFSAFDYAWSPDGKRIAWVGGRSDVSPVDVNVLTVGGTSTPVANDTNAFSASYTADGKSVLFANGDTTEIPVESASFAFREGGIYSVEAPAPPQPLITGNIYYSDVQSLPAGEVAFTESSQDSRIKTILVLANDRTRRKIAETPGGAPPPVWAGDMVAYVGTAVNEQDRPLLVSAKEGATETIDTGVDAFAWALLKN
ncbi:MAG: TolB family protein [Mycobacterium sp.]